MKLERTNNEILVRLPANVDVSELQDLLDYLQYQELTTDSKAGQEEVDNLSDEVNQSIWETFKKQRGRK